MTFDENLMLEYIEYLSRTIYDYDPSFDGFVRIDPAKCEANKHLSFQQQNQALRGLVDADIIEGKREGGDSYFKIIKHIRHKAKPSHLPRDEAERLWMKASLYPEEFSPHKHMPTILYEIDAKYSDPERWN